MPNVLFHLQFPAPTAEKKIVLSSLLESSDLWTKTSAGDGSNSFAATGVTISSGVNAGAYAYILKNASYAPFFMDWTKKRVLRFYASVGHSDDATSKVYAGCGTMFTNETGFGIKFENNKIRGFAANGGAPEYADLITGLVPFWSEAHHYELIFTPGVSVEIYVDGILTATITAQLPTGAGGAYIPFKAAAYRGAAGGHGIITSGYEIEIGL